MWGDRSSREHFQKCMKFESDFEGKLEAYLYVQAMSSNNYIDYKE